MAVTDVYADKYVVFLDLLGFKARVNDADANLKARFYNHHKRGWISRLRQFPLHSLDQPNCLSSLGHGNGAAPDG